MSIATNAFRVGLVAERFQLISDHVVQQVHKLHDIALTRPQE